MADEVNPENNQRVTNKILQRDILEINRSLEILPKMQTQLHDIDVKLAVACDAVQRNKEDIDDLQKSSKTIDVILGAGTVLGTIVGSLFGGKS